MSTTRMEAFRQERRELTDLVLEHAGLEIKRFFSLDSQSYREGAVPARTKEMLGLVASLVLRCDDCVLYHLDRCRQEGVTDEELMEVLGIGLVVGGSITIPHLRRAVRTWVELGEEGPDTGP